MQNLLVSRRVWVHVGGPKNIKDAGVLPLGIGALETRYSLVLLSLWVKPVGLGRGFPKIFGKPGPLPLDRWCGSPLETCHAPQVLQ